MSDQLDQATVNQEWEPVDELLVTLLAEGWTHRRVASFCDISTKTIQRRLKDPVFSDQVSRRKRERLTAIAVRLTRINDKALDVLEDAMGDEDVKVRMGAAKAALDYQERYHRRAVFEADVEERISEMERGFTGLAGDGDLAHVGDPRVLPINNGESEVPEATRFETMITIETNEVA
jgi:hypothetical protein